MLRAPTSPGSVRVGAPFARRAPALASLRLRVGRARRCLPARCAQEGVGAQLAAGAQLDAAAAAVAAIRAKLPYIDARELVGDNVKYSFITPLVTLTGSSDYLRVMSHWRQTVPQRLGVGWKWEVVRIFQPDARTLVVRWRMTWIQSLFGAPLWAEQPLLPGAPQAADDEPAVSVSVSRLVDSLKSSEKALERGLAELDASSAASAALNDALRSLREGVQQSQALASEVAAAEAAVESLPGAGWMSSAGLQKDDPEAAKLRAELAALREDATSRVTGSSTFILDADGRVISHADMLDFDDFMSTSAALDTMMQDRNAASAAGQEAAAQEELAMRTSASKADALFQLCVAMRLPECGSWEWRLDVTRQLLWEFFIRDEDTDDEMRISITREDFDELVTLVILGSAFFVFASTSYLAYWLVFVAPELPAQLSQFSGLAPDGGDGLAPLRSSGSMTSWLSSLSSALQPSLFR